MDKAMDVVLLGFGRWCGGQWFALCFLGNHKRQNDETLWHIFMGNLDNCII